jgi:hypothetical protein
MDAEIGVDGNQQQARQERKKQKAEGFHGSSFTISNQASEVLKTSEACRG